MYIHELSQTLVLTSSCPVAQAEQCIPKAHVASLQPSEPPFDRQSCSSGEPDVPVLGLPVAWSVAAAQHLPVSQSSRVTSPSRIQFAQETHAPSKHSPPAQT